jgi:hypothetical protein
MDKLEFAKEGVLGKLKDYGVLVRQIQIILGRTDQFHLQS